jgi:IS30 family transposase
LKTFRLSAPTADFKLLLSSEYYTLLYVHTADVINRKRVFENEKPREKKMKKANKKTHEQMNRVCVCHKFIATVSKTGDYQISQTVAMDLHVYHCT